MKRLLRVLPIVALVLTGCDAVSERDCEVFDHPDLALWQADTAPATVSYMSADGASIVFNRQSVTFNEPFLGSDGSSNDEDVVCNLTATVRMVATDNSLAISSIYQQEERFLLDSADEALRIDHRIEAPAGTELLGDYPADISDDRVRSNSNPGRVEYLELEEEQTIEEASEEIGGQSYIDVIRIDALELTPASVPETDIETGTAIEPETENETQAENAADTDTESADIIKQIVVAREFGIVAFTDAQEQEFVLVPSQ